MHVAHLLSVVLHERLHVALLPPLQLSRRFLRCLLRTARLFRLLPRRLQLLLQLLHLALAPGTTRSRTVSMQPGVVAIDGNSRQRMQRNVSWTRMRSKNCGLAWLVCSNPTCCLPTSWLRTPPPKHT